MRYLRFIIAIMITSFVIFEGIVFGIICVPRNVFETSYNSLIQDKFDILMSTNEPKIIMVSGSSSAFGLNQSMLQEASGYEVVNLGLHAGFGHLFSSELAKANINEGDIVLLGYEYGWQADTGFTRSGADVIMSGIDDNVRMYKYLPPTIWRNCLGYLFTFASKKNDYPTETGIYSREAFDPLTGQMTMARTSNMEWNEEKYGCLDISNVYISEKSIEYLKEFKTFVESRGASIYFVSPPLIEDSIACDYSEFTKLKELEEEKIGIRYISDPIQYIYPSKYMYNSNYHCNSAGEDVRTEMLIEDLRNASVIK